MRCADVRAYRDRIEFRDWKQVLRVACEGWKTGVGGGEKKRIAAKGAGGSVARFWPSLFPGLLSKAFRRGAKIGERF